MLGQLVQESQNGNVSIELIVYAIAIAIIIATVITFIDKKAIYPFASRIIKEKRFSKKEAITIGEMKIGSFFLKLALRGSTVNNIFSYCTKKERAGIEEKNSKKKVKVNVTERCYYLEEKNEIKANAFYVNKKNSLITLILSIIGIVVIAILVAKFLPMFIGYAEDVISQW